METLAFRQLLFGQWAFFEWLEDCMDQRREWTTGMNELVIPVDLEWVRSSQNDVGSLEWTTVETQSASSSDARQCLYELVDLGLKLDPKWVQHIETDSFRRLVTHAEFAETNTEPDLEDIPSLILPFVQRWGISDVMDIDEEQVDRSLPQNLFSDSEIEFANSSRLDGSDLCGQLYPSWVIDFALEVSATVILLHHTDYGIVVDDDRLWLLRDADPQRPSLPTLAPPSQLSATEYIEWARQAPFHARQLQDQEHKDLWHRERQEGRGLDIQRRTVAGMLQRYAQQRAINFIWDERGRQVELSGVGFADLVAHALTAIFTASELDFDICSICGHVFDPPEGRRRPKPGTRRFCGEDCREAGRREAQREYWHRNKHRLRSKESKNA